MTDKPDVVPSGADHKEEVVSELRENRCPKAPPGGVFHCEHLRHKKRDSFRTETVYQCCHCGKSRTVIQEHGSSGYRHTTPDDHGPHMPRVGVPQW